MGSRMRGPLPAGKIVPFARRASRYPGQLWGRIKDPLLRICPQLSYLSRSAGLRALNYIKQKQHEPEQAKAVLQKSFWIALSRCAVHLAPMTVFILLSYVNLKTTYIGPGLSVKDRYDGAYFALFQVAAKIQELLCLASMGTILLDVLRHDMLYGNGTPLGLVSAHIWFSQPSSLLSPDYLATVFSSVAEAWTFLVCGIKRGPRRERAFSFNWSRVRLALLILILILLAVFTGPFTAVLLIPRDTTFPAGGTRYLLNASAEELWPSVVDTDEEYDACFWSNATQYGVCPSGGYASLRDRRSFNVGYDGITNKPGRQADWSLLNVNSLVLDPQNIMPGVFSAGQTVEVDRTVATYACQPSMYSATILQILLRDWDTATWSDEAVGGPFSPIPEFKHAMAPMASASITYPLSQIRCTVPQNLSRNAEEAEFRFIQYPAAMPYGWSNSTTTRTANLTGLRLEPTNHLRLQWVPLPAQDFSPVSTGLIFELPWSQPSDSRLAVACTIVASWVQGEVARAEGADYLAWHTVRDDIPFYMGITMGTRATDPSAAIMQRGVQLSPQWLELLTPEAPDPFSTNDSWRPTTLENIFALAGFETFMEDSRTRPRYLRIGDSCTISVLDATLTDMELWAAVVCYENDMNDFIEWKIASLISDGLSRRLSYRAFDTTPMYRSWITKPFPTIEPYELHLMQPNTDAIVLSTNPSLIVQRLVINVRGLCYRVSTSTEYIAMVVIGAYLLLSFVHVLWTLNGRVTSSSWDTVTELMLLAWNSPPSKTLAGTSAQVHQWHTYNRVVKIRAEPVEDLDSADQSTLRLRLLVDEPSPDDIARKQESLKTGPTGGFHVVKEGEKYD